MIGEYQPDVVAHQGIERSMDLASRRYPGLTWEWVGTATIGPRVAARLQAFSGIWLVPASPYADEAAALTSITYARTHQIPFLGTCGGFQHAIIEFAREVLKLPQASHGETSPDAALQLISPLRCSLVERKGTVHLLAGGRLREIYGSDVGEEGYHCSYGLNASHEYLFERAIPAGPNLRIAARDDQGEVRAVELPGHPFFFATLFQPERQALTGHLHPIIRAFIEAAQ